MVFGERHFNHLVTEWLEHYHLERPHQAKDNDVLVLPKEKRRTKCQARPPKIQCRERLGGLVKHYYRRAA